MHELYFEKWIESYSESLRGEFHRDGVINEEVFSNEKRRILFVTKEPNSKDGNYDKYKGADLRKIWGEICLKKPFDRNIARWTRIICDGDDPGGSVSWQDIARTMQRVAIINLKKLAGSGSENREEICLYSYNDREFIRKQIELINPNVIIACGKDGLVFRMLWRIMYEKGKICFPAAITKEFLVCIQGRNIPVFCTYHPSLRLKKHEGEAAATITDISRRFKQI